MKTKIYLPVAAMAALFIIFPACKKEGNLATNQANSFSATGAIAIGTTAGLTTFATTGSASDSLYIVNCFNRKSRKDSVAFSTLPAAVGTYLTANYAGYTASKAFKITDSEGIVVNYIAVIKLNNNPVGLKFTTAGMFVNVLEQRAGSDLGGRGWHDGGPFCNRDGVRRDTIALTALPAAVKSFFTATYPADTLLHAYTTRDTTYMLISKNQGLYATGITAAGNLVKRLQVSEKPGKPVAVNAANLPAIIAAYLTTTYPGYVFNKAFSVSAGNLIKEYNVFVTANSTNYAVKFTAAGVFVKVSVIR